MFAPPEKNIMNRSHSFKETRTPFIDNDKLYSYQGVNVLFDDEIRYNDAKIRAHNERWVLPQPHQHPVLNIKDIGVSCRKSLPDDDTLTKSVFENSTPYPLTDVTTAHNIKVYPINPSTNSTYVLKKKTTLQNSATDDYTFNSIPFRDNRSSNSLYSFSSQRDSSRKTEIKNYDNDSNSNYVLFDIGNKPARQPVSKQFPIGINTTINN